LINQSVDRFVKRTLNKALIGATRQRFQTKASAFLTKKLQTNVEAMYTVTTKNIPNIIDCHLKNKYPILIIFRISIFSTTGHQMTV